MLAAIRSFFFNLHGLHRFGSFLNPLSAKKSCSPAVKINSSPQSMHRRTLSMYSCTGVSSLDRLALVRRAPIAASVYRVYTAVSLQELIYRPSLEGRNHLTLRFAAILLDRVSTTIIAG